MVRIIRVSKVLDDSRVLRIPLPAELHPGDEVDIEITFRDSSASNREWKHVLDNVKGIFADQPLELPDDPPPMPFHFEE